MQIILTGDVMLGRLVNSVLDKDKYTYVWGDTIDIIRDADLSLVNLECVISSRGSKWAKTPKVFHFRASLDAIDVLKSASIDYVALANNHTLDYGYDALEEMLRLLDENKISHSGAGRNLKEAMAPSVIRSTKIKVGVISLTDNQPEWEATDNSTGTNYFPLDMKNDYANRLRECINSARNSADIVIVACHVGPHFREDPCEEYVNFAHHVIELGADVYWGHSNHMPQGIEIYKDKTILFDCGDFIDDYAVDAYYRNDLSFLFKLDFERDAIKNIELVPTTIHNLHASTALSWDADLVMKRMVDRCSRLGTKCVIDRGRIHLPNS